MLPMLTYHFFLVFHQNSCHSKRPLCEDWQRAFLYISALLIHRPAHPTSLLLTTLKTFLIQIHGLHIRFPWSKFAIKTELFSVDLQVDLSKYYFAQEETACDEATLSQHKDYFLCKCSNHTSSSKTFITKLRAEENKFLKNFKTYLLWWMQMVSRSFRHNFEASKIANPHSYVSCPSALISSLILLWQETSKLCFTTKKHGALCLSLKHSISGTRKTCLIRGHPYLSAAWGQNLPLSLQDHTIQCGLLN